MHTNYGKKCRNKGICFQFSIYNAHMSHFYIFYSAKMMQFFTGEASATTAKVFLWSIRIITISLLVVGIYESFPLDDIIWSRRGSLEPDQNPWISNINDPAVSARTYRYESFLYWCWKLSCIKYFLLAYELQGLSEGCRFPFMYPFSIGVSLVAWV